MASGLSSTAGMSSLAYILLISLVVLVSVAILSALTLLILRRIRLRRATATALPTHTTTLRPSHLSHRRSSSVSLSTSPVAQPRPPTSEKQYISATVAAVRQSSPLPEIRVHYPAEFDNTGRQAPGRVAVVRIRDMGVELEPMDGEQLPPYRK